MAGDLSTIERPDAVWQSFPADRLSELGNIARREHLATLNAMRASLEHALQVGAALAEAKDLLPAGKWMEWTKRELGVTSKMANRYIDLYEHRDAIPAGERSISGALRALGPVVAPRKGGGWQKKMELTPEQLAEAQRRRDEGWTYTQIAAPLGVSERFIAQRLQPEAAKRWASNREANRVAARQAERVRLEREVAEHDSPAGQALKLLRLAAEAIAMAVQIGELSAEQVRDARRHTEMAGNGLHRLIRSLRRRSA